MKHVLKHSAPVDSLEFRMNTSYRNNGERVWSTRADVIMQPQSWGRNRTGGPLHTTHHQACRSSGETRRRQVPWRSDRSVMVQGHMARFKHPLITSVLDLRTDINHVKLAIDGLHVTQTNNGYTRNNSGGFYTT